MLSRAGASALARPAGRIVRSHDAVAVGGAAASLQSRGMAENLKEISNRIVSTKNIQKITKSMKMVSAAKLRGDTERLEKGRAFGRSMQPLLLAEAGPEDTPLPEAKNPFYVILSSDRGLCGGVNSFVVKLTKLKIAEDEAKGLSPKVFVIGDKGHGAMARTHGQYLVGQMLECSKTPTNFNKALLIADRIISAAGDADVIKLMYNRHKSTIVYETESMLVPNYPVIAAAASAEGAAEGSNELPFPLGKYDEELESTEEALQNLFEFGLATQLYGCLIESATSEQSARMTAMDGASKNAGEMVDKLTVKYNRARQAKITTELIEIVSGAEALKG